MTVPQSNDGWELGYQIRNKIRATGHKNILKYKQLKLEKGNIATDWTPAPEDLDGVQTQPAPLASMTHIEHLENQVLELREMIALRGLSR